MYLIGVSFDTLSMETLDLEIYRGDTFVQELTILDSDDNPIDVTSYTFSSQVKRAASSEEALAEFEVSIIDGPNGIVQILLHPADTQDMPVPSTSWVWDFEVATDDATPVVTTYFKGEVTVVGDVTR